MKKISILISVCVLLLWGLPACSDDVEYSTSTGDRLSFSTDSVKFDTLFTTLGSSTRVLQIYNHNSKALKITSIVQAAASTSGFRVNVDGQFATTFDNLEVRSGDSMYVFVEITPTAQQSNLPVMIADSLIFTLESGVRQSVKLVAYGQDATTLRAPHFTADSTLTATKPYLVYDSLLVDSGVTLTLEPGTRLFFHKGVKCLIRGTLNATGTAQAPILFRGDRTDNMFTDMPYDLIPGQWGGIKLYESSYNNAFIYCDIHSSQYGIKCEMADPSRLKLTVENSVIQNASGNVLEMTMCRAMVGNSLLVTAGGHCVSILGGAASFVHCTIANFYSWSARGEALRIDNIKNDTIYPLFGVDFVNCIITGDGADEIKGSVAEKSDSVDYSQYAIYSFSYSLINSTDSSNTHFTHITWDKKSNEVWGVAQFKSIYNTNRHYNFHLDSLSTARDIANPDYAAIYPYDLDGNNRLADGKPDAGCYEWQNAKSDKPKAIIKRR